MFSRRLSVVGAALLATATVTATASAQEHCVGLDCPGVTPQSSAAHGPIGTRTPSELEKTKISGFYDFGTMGPSKKRAVAYVVARGEWDEMPAEIRQLPAARSISAQDRANNTIVIYEAGVATSTPATPTATTARNKSKKKKPPKAYAAGFDDCPSGWFCLFDSENGQGSMGIWQSTGFWQNLFDYGWGNRAESMRNRRSGWTLLSKEPGGAGGGRYCAQPFSQDGTFTNNSSYQNTAEGLYNSSSGTFHSEWNCIN